MPRSRTVVTSSVAPAAPASAAGVHLTVRGRTVFLLGLVALLLAAFSLGRQQSSAATPPTVAPVLQQTTVTAGETLWSLAHRVAPENDPREVVEQLRELNHLRSSDVWAGQQLLLPRAA